MTLSPIHAPVRLEDSTVHGRGDSLTIPDTTGESDFRDEAQRERASQLHARASAHGAACGAGPLDGLTLRQREVVDMAARGLSNAEIAARLVVTRRTVESHLTTAFRTLGVKRRTQLAGLLAPSLSRARGLSHLELHVYLTGIQPPHSSAPSPLEQLG